MSAFGGKADMHAESYHWPIVQLDAPPVNKYDDTLIFLGADQYRGALMVKRTTLRSSKGTKLYAVRDAKGRFKDIQTYKRAHGQDIKRGSKAERAKAKK
jgi:hypothetical protein